LPALPVVDMKQLSITILRDDISYDQLSSVLSSDMIESVRDIKIKKDAVAMQDLLANFSVQQDNLQTWFADWKAILKSYIEKKYPENVDVYLQLLQDMKLL
jgi:glutaredoxin-related protein